MKKILIIGAGRSTLSLINYMLQLAEARDWMLVVADKDLHLVTEKIAGNPRARALKMDVTDEISRVRAIAEADLVISMLPADMHVPVAIDCVALRKHLVTASYVSEGMQKLHERAVEADVILMNEVGVDPGIDHISAKKVIDDIVDKGGKMLIFESFTGGLPAPESDDNPWHYKFSWNPRNVVLAGSGGAVKFIQEGQYKYIPYHMVFRRTEFIDIEGYGRFEGYANRDSLRYRSVYGLHDIPTIYRGTLRRPGFCRAWDIFVKLGMTDDSYEMENAHKLTKRQFFNSFLAYHPTDSVELKLMHYMDIPQDQSDLLEKFSFLGLFDEEPLPLESVSKPTPARILQAILEEKWQMKPGDRDMIVMWHKFGYELDGQKKMCTSHMIFKGVDHRNTAMAHTVGIPVAIAARLILEGKITSRGVQIPITPEIYLPMLEELKQYGVHFVEKEIPYKNY
ncbi:saccharopine dehydrogenase [Thermaurantimonas aggregans]|uniref:Saccharopine dehydrogenase n=1 Tax=Thermaurantimonas aggregans TaxID=2173829 RepID=A0A401XLH0_9FLAO|nr:saccharopine dehydrogenase C-terminal domain-containing protein [Thermaurantimonas aggregans]MCX8148333.1 saccharopine dehydrogenase NADP-binding domain-containing protein [Thermaurantimonas aggregans]GCD77838.1 saccharopine dehydrogenase [Thermaurantimonas aggregans]